MSDAKTQQILMVDDEALVLAGYLRTIGRTCNVTCAEGGPAALKIIESAGPFAAVVTDMRMPTMNGIEFITAARAKSRESVYMMLTGNADQQTAINAINQGHIFRFLNKPCPPEVLATAIRDAIRQYELVTAERVLLRDTFAGTIKFMVEALEMSNPELLAFQANAKQIQQRLCVALGIRAEWKLVVSGSLCLIGLLTLPKVDPSQGLSDETLQKAALIGSKLLAHIPRINDVVAMISRQREPAAPLPADLKNLMGLEYETFGAQLLRFSVDLAREQRLSTSRALAAQRLAKSGAYDRRLIDVFAAQPERGVLKGKPLVAAISMFDLRQGMIVAADVHNSEGKCVITAGQSLSDMGLTSLQNFAQLGLVPTKIMVYVDAESIATAA